MMFEHYGFDSAYVAIQAVLTLYAQGLLTGTPISLRLPLLPNYCFTVPLDRYRTYWYLSYRRYLLLGRKILLVFQELFLVRIF